MAPDSITLIAPYLEPDGIGPRATRSRRLAAGFREAGRPVHAIVTDGGRGPDRAVGAEPLAAARGPLIGRMEEPGIGFRRRLRAAAVGRARRALPLPDAHIGWALNLARSRGLARPPSPATILYAVAAPFSSLVLGAVLSRRWGVPLIGDLGDPRPLRGPGEARLAAWTMTRLSALVVTNERTAASYREHVSPGLPIVVAPNGADELGRTAGGAGLPPLFLQLGTLSGSRVDPNPAFGALAGLEREGRLRFRSHGEAWVRLDRRVERHHLGVLSGDEARALMSAATALLVVGNRDATQIPSKVYEIARSRAWGLYVSELDGEPGAAILGRSGHGVVCANSEREIRAGALELLAREARGERPTPSPAFEWRCTVDRVVALVEANGRGGAQRRSTLP